MVSEAEQMGADAVKGVDVDYESIQVGQGGSMLAVSASGTAVKL
jgi:Raf kinase inhibitor-like YbhB/YbcL family protein